MLIEYSFTGVRKNQKCHIALCDDSVDTIKETVLKYWQSHGVEEGSWGKFEFHRNDDDEFVALTACTEINAVALEFCLSTFEGMLGERCSIPELMNIIRDFDKKITERNNNK